MKFLVGLGLLSTISMVNADQDVEFLTKLVNDYKDHTGDYFNFIRTAKSVPNQFSALATQVGTYTDDSYTTMLNSVDIEPLEEFATEFPWYSSRLEVADDDDSDKSSEADSEATTSGSSSESSESSGDDSDSESESSTGGVGSLAAPVGAVLGAIGVALL